MAAADRPAIWWVRRDFRLSDNPALRAAGKGRGPWMQASLAALDADLRSVGGPGLTVVRGKPSIEIPRIARHVGAERVHISADFAPYGRRRDATVEAALADDGVTQWRPAPCTPRSDNHSKYSPRSTGPGSSTECARLPGLSTLMR